MKSQLAVSLEAAAQRGDALDHVLLAGPPGLGKTSLAQILAAELDVPFVMTAGPALERKGDIAAYLTALEPRSIFFVDEIHRLPRALEETFYPAMEDRQLPITVGQGAGARVVTLDLPPFTLVGATTRAGLLTTPLRDRFGIQHRLEPYDGPRSRGDRPPQRRDPRRRDRRGRRRGDRRAARAARRGSPTGCSSACATTPRCAGRASSTRPPPTRRSTLLEIDDAGPGPPRPRDPRRDLPEVRRGPRRPVDARGHGRRGAGHDRGRLRALPAAVRLPQAHAARPRRDRARLRPPRPRATAAPEPGLF